MLDVEEPPTEEDVRTSGSLSELDEASGIDSDGDAIERVKSSHFGDKSITYWGSFVLNLNNVMGPACVLLPLLNQMTGFFLPTLALFLIFVLSSFACTMLCEAAQRIPGNRSFRKRMEFCALVEYYYGARAGFYSQIFYNLSLQASNIAAMIVSAQVLDNFIMQAFHHSYALDYTHFDFIASIDDPERPWRVGGTEQGAQTNYVISLGFVVSLVICIPFGWLKLEENMLFQWVSFVGLLIFTGEFLVQFILNSVPGSENYIPGNGPLRTPFATSNTYGLTQVLGVSVFAYAYVVTIPSWLSEKKNGVNVNRAIWWPALGGFLLKFFIGLFGAWAFVLVRDGKRVPGSENILNILAETRYNPMVTVYSSYLWNLLTLVPGIPVLAIMVKYNLINGGIMNGFWANMFGVVLPWVVTAFCYEQQVLVELCNWVAILVQGYVNFVLPILLYREALIRYPRPEDDDVRGWCARPGRWCGRPHRTRVLDPSESAGLFAQPSAAPQFPKQAPTSINASVTDELLVEPPRPPRVRIEKLDDDMLDSEIDSNTDIDSVITPNPASGTKSRPHEDLVSAVPNWMRHYGVHPIVFANSMAGFFFVLCSAAIIVNVIVAATQDRGV